MTMEVEGQPKSAKPKGRKSSKAATGRKSSKATKSRAAKSSDPVADRKTADRARIEEKAQSDIWGSVALKVSFDVTTKMVADKLNIEYQCLGIVAEPDSVAEHSGNRKLVKNVTTEEDFLTITFNEPLLPGTYGFELWCGYNESVESVTDTRPEVQKSQEDLQREGQENPSDPLDLD